MTLAKCFVYLLNVSADSAFILSCMCLHCIMIIVVVHYCQSRSLFCDVSSRRVLAVFTTKLLDC